jgi:50S ribosomal subunit-associated GTPase HflX
VNRLLKELGHADIPQILVLNKKDLVDSAFAQRMADQMAGVAISAIEAETTHPLLARLEGALWDRANLSVSPTE